MVFHACLCVNCLDLHALCFMPCFLCLDLFFPMFLIFRSTCFHVLYHVFVPRSILPMCCLARSTWFYACLHVYLSFLRALCSMPCFPILCYAFCSMSTLGLLAHVLVWCCWLCLTWISVFMCIFPCYMVWSLSSHAYMLGFMFFHVYVLGLYMLMCMFLCLCLDLCFHMPMCLDLCSLQALYYLPCACVLHAMFVCLDLGYVCHAMCYCSPFVAFVYFSYVLAIW